MSKNILTRKTIQIANTFLGKFNNYFKEIPLNDIFKTLQDINLVILQEDQTKWEGFLCGEQGRAVFDIGNIFTKNENNQYEKYDNVQLILTWYKMQSNNFEIVCYIS